MYRTAPLGLIVAFTAAASLAFTYSDRVAPSPNPMAGPVIPSLGGPGGSGPGFVSGFTDRDEWLAAASPFIISINFEGISDGTPIDTELLPDGVMSVTGSSPNATPAGPVQQFVTASSSQPFPMFIPGTLPSESNFLSNDLSMAGGAATGEITFEFFGATAVGAFIADADPLGDFTITLFQGQQEIASIDLPPRMLPDSFVGVVSSEWFSAARFSAAEPTDSWGLDDLEHDGGQPECFLALGGGLGRTSFTPFFFTFDTQLADVAAWYPVLMEDYPAFTLPSLSAVLDGGLAGGHATVSGDAGWPDFVNADGTFAAQLMMWNPVDVPSAPEQYSPVLLCWIAPDGEVHARLTGEGTIDIALETSVNAQGDMVFSFPFAIPGF